MRSLVGSTLGRFRVERWIGKGGMGAVYAAFDERLERNVALKVLLEDEDSPIQKRRFLREARLAAQVTHPNIATVYEVDEIDGRVTIVMELLEGVSLRRLLGERRLEIQEVVDIARDIARALARAHKSGIVHRDIKPENVFITEPAPGALHAKVLDFGLARQRDPSVVAGVAPLDGKHETTTTTHLWGTPGYMSPEQAEGQAVDARSDVFSFGSVLYEMLAGIRPFRAENNVAVLLAIARKEPRPIRDIVPTLSAALEEILHKCMKKAKEERFADGAALSAAIETMIRGAPISSRDLTRESRPSFESSPALASSQPSQPSQPSASSHAMPFATTHDRRPSMADDLVLRLKAVPRKTLAGLSVGIGTLVLVLAVVGFARSPTRTAEAAAVAAIGGDVPPPPPANVVAPPQRPPTMTDELDVEPEPASAPVETAPADPPPPPPPAPKPKARPSATKGKSGDCAQPFIVDSKGVKIPKMHCL